MYNQTNERFLAFEHKQLDQIRRILSTLTSDQLEILSGKTKIFSILLFLFFFVLLESEDDSLRPERDFNNLPTPILVQSESNQIPDDEKAETDWNELLEQVCRRSSVFF
jgi:hypothetical protein